MPTSISVESAKEVARKNKRQTLAVSDVVAALRECGFTKYVAAVEEAVAEHIVEQKEKKDKKENNDKKEMIEKKETKQPKLEQTADPN